MKSRALLAVLAAMSSLTCRSSESMKPDARLFSLFGRAKGDRDSCGQLIPDVQVSEILLVTAESCLSCRDVGWLVRKRNSELSQSSDALGIITLSSDSAAVCGYLRSEKTSAPVVVSSDAPVGAGVSNATLVLLQKTEGHIVRTSGENGLAILRSIETGPKSVGSKERNQ